ncbi:isochorismate lyase [Rubrobacter tropicus]|uniref:Isochorismate lyase n=1 Tax=Rubrobacter tropicus TaxID=2653851 RepID=A0A6G8QEN0_9ACTN|nr:isochorismate lyase [Rubrobacter tropicus]QIN84898.1 isochorismate lyase [Rubrobacter tropicus]
MKPPEECAKIEDVREAIDGLDHEILTLLGRRAHYVTAATRFKTGPDSVRAPERQRAMLALRRRWAEEANLDPDFVEKLYKDIVSHFVAREMEHWRGDQA